MYSTIGVSSAYLNLGREPRPYSSLRRRVDEPVDLPLPDHEEWRQRIVRLKELQDLVSLHHENAFDRQKVIYDKKRRYVVFKEGDRIMHKAKVTSLAQKGVTRELGLYKRTGIENRGNKYHSGHRFSCLEGFGSESPTRCRKMFHNVPKSER